MAELIQKFGYVAEPVREKNNPTIEVLSAEDVPTFEGELKHNNEKLIFDLKDIDGKKVCTKANLVNTISCEFFGDANKMDVPDVHRGETVMILQYAGSDNWFWMPCVTDSRVRQTEHKKIHIAAKDNLDECDDTNSYTIELNSREDEGNGYGSTKYVRIKTSDALGEEFTYVIEVDTSNSTVTIADNVGNKVLMQSELSRVLLENALESRVDVVGPDVYVSAINHIGITSAKTASVTSIDALTLSGGSVAIMGGACTINSSALTVSPTTTFNGPANFNAGTTGDRT